MKISTFLLPIFLTAFLFLGCENFTRHDFNFINKSDFEIKFSLEDYADYKDAFYTLSPNEIITLNCYDNPRVQLQNNVRAYFVSGTSSGTFKNEEKYKYKILNPIFDKVYLFEKNKKITENPIDYICLEAASVDENLNAISSSTEISVYTSKPHFSAYKIENNSECDEKLFSKNCKCHKTDVTENLIITKLQN